MRNAVTYDISKIKVILFSNARKKKLLEQLTTTKLKFDGQFIRFNQETTQQLGMQLDSRLNFGPYLKKS